MSLYWERIKRIRVVGDGYGSEDLPFILRLSAVISDWQPLFALVLSKQQQVDFGCCVSEEVVAVLFPPRRRSCVTAHKPSEETVH